MSIPRLHVLIPAAGSGRRYDDTELKQYQPLHGKTVLAHVIGVFHCHPLVSSVTVVLAKDDQVFESAVGPLSAAVKTVTGGETRVQSVRNGLQSIADDHPGSDWVLVHDAARPCLSQARLDAFLDIGLASSEGAILAMPVGDTLKREGAAREISGTVDRNGLWAAQTPQLFRIGALLKAIDAARKKGCEITDEASAMEFVGARPLLVMGSASNLKITHPGDLAIAEALLTRIERPS